MKYLKPFSILESIDNRFEFKNSFVLAIGITDVLKKHESDNIEILDDSYMLSYYGRFMIDRNNTSVDASALELFNTSSVRQFKNFFDFDFTQYLSKDALTFFIKELNKYGFSLNNSFYQTSGVTFLDADYFYTLYCHDIETCKDAFLKFRECFEKAKLLHWKQLIEKDYSLKFKCPNSILTELKSPIVHLNDIGLLERILKFDQFNDSRVWEPGRIKTLDRNMPSVNRQSDYIQTVKEEITILLKNIYNFTKQQIDEIQNLIWLKFKKEWQFILNDSLVNWDTPNVCAQKCLTYLNNYIDFLKT